MKILFLDIDGVLNNAKTRTTTHDGWLFVDDVLVKRLKRIIDATGSKIVLSSTWRDGWHKVNGKEYDEPYFIQLCDKLKEYGMEIWDALSLPLQSKRGYAIGEWFNAHKNLKIESFVILDDWNDMCAYRDHLIWTDPGDGLTDKNVREAIEMLNS